MRCYQPTIITSYDVGESFHLVRRQFNVDHQHINEFVKKHGDHELVYLSRKERNKFFELDHKHYTKVDAIVDKSLIIPCGQCEACLKSSSNHWAQRIVADQLVCNRNMFLITLTYDDDHLPVNCSLNKEAAKYLTWKIRNAYPGCHYFLCGEYGDHTARPHYHLLLWNIDELQCNRDGIAGRSKGNILYYVSVPWWNNGRVTAEEVSGSSSRGVIAAYVSKYVNKKRLRTDEEKEILKLYNFEPEFQFMSRGIGYNYYQLHFDDYDKDHRSHVLSGGVRFNLDRSFLKAKEKFTGIKDNDIFSDIVTMIAADDSIQRSNSVNIMRLHEGGSRKL